MRYLCTVYREPVINVVVVVGLEQNCVHVVPRLGPQIHWSCDEPQAGALRSMGDHSESLGKLNKNTQREGFYARDSHQEAVGGKRVNVRT